MPNLLGIKKQKKDKKMLDFQQQVVEGWTVDISGANA